LLLLLGGIPVYVWMNWREARYRVAARRAERNVGPPPRLPVGLGS